MLIRLAMWKYEEKNAYTNLHVQILTNLHVQIFTNLNVQIYKVTQPGRNLDNKIRQRALARQG